MFCLGNENEQPGIITTSTGPKEETKHLPPVQQIRIEDTNIKQEQKTPTKFEKIYEQDAYVQKFQAKIVEISEQGDCIHMLLDLTAFYPGGGGQEPDSGTLEGNNCVAKVIEVYEKEGNVWHVCKTQGNFSQDDTVVGFIDWQRRYPMMKYHTAEHTLFHCLSDIFRGIEMVKVQITPEGSSIFVKYPGELEMEKILQAERKANMVISKQLPVMIREYKKENIPAGTRAKLERIDSDTVRVVQIGDFDLCACTGLHVKNTIEIGLLTVSNINSEGVGQYKISFLIGEEAQDYLLQTKLACDRACSILQTTSDKLERTTENLKAQKEKLEQAVKTLNERILDEMQPARVSGYNFYSKSLSNMDNKKIMQKAGELIKTGRTMVLLSNKEEDKGFLLIAKSLDVSHDIKAIANKTFQLMNGKGGGQDNFISGAGDASKLFEAFDFAEAEITKKLSGGP